MAQDSGRSQLGNDRLLYQRVDDSRKSGNAREAAERKRAEAGEVNLRAANRTPILGEDSTTEDVDVAAADLEQAMTGTLDELAKKKRWC
jgi:hypothetical protein